MFQLLKKKLKDQRGLTLIELLAVIVILGIIAAIAIPAIGKLISHTQDKATVSEGVQIINAAKLYVSATSPVDASKAVTTAELGEYLDNVKSANTGYTVTISHASGKYTYVLTDHPSVALVDATTAGGNNDSKAQESELLSYK